MRVLRVDGFNVNSVREVLLSNGIRPSKAMGQNFLVDPNIPEKIVRLAGFGGCDGVLEVGSGLGALTVSLCLAAGRVMAVELDERLLPFLREALAGFENVDITHGDIMKLNLKELLSEKMKGLELHVCANLPYSITTPAIALFINSGLFKTITVMIQREVAQRICATPGSSDYGAFTVFANYYTEAETLFNVPPECFEPRPSVYSTVVKLKTLETGKLSAQEEALLFKVVRAAFGQRRKTLVNALHAVFGNEVSKDDIAAVIRGCGFDERIRGEVLGVDEFITLSKSILKKS